LRPPPSSSLLPTASLLLPFGSLLVVVLPTDQQLYFGMETT
jgi:hypothetical protein